MCGGVNVCEIIVVDDDDGGIVVLGIWMVDVCDEVVEFGDGFFVSGFCYLIGFL